MTNTPGTRMLRAPSKAAAPLRSAVVAAVLVLASVLAGLTATSANADPLYPIPDPDPFYWAPPDVQIGEAILADDRGTIGPFTYTVPSTVSVGEYTIIARMEAVTVTAQARFRVTK